MQVKEIMTYNAETIDSSTSCVEAAQKMKALDVGALPVSEEDELCGMITDRDIVVRCIAEGKDPSKCMISEIMTPELVYCFEDDDIEEAASVMEEKAIHRLLVVDSENEPVGFLALSDFAVKSQDEHLTYELLERICEPACPNR